MAPADSGEPAKGLSAHGAKQVNRRAKKAATVRHAEYTVYDPATGSTIKGKLSDMLRLCPGIKGTTVMARLNSGVRNLALLKAKPGQCKPNKRKWK